MLINSLTNNNIFISHLLQIFLEYYAIFLKYYAIFLQYYDNFIPYTMLALNILIFTLWNIATTINCSPEYSRHSIDNLFDCNITTDTDTKSIILELRNISKSCSVSIHIVGFKNTVSDLSIGNRIKPTNIPKNNRMKIIEKMGIF